MRDETYARKIDAVKRILKRLKQEDLSEEDGEELYKEGLDRISEARELLDVGQGNVEVTE